MRNINTAVTAITSVRLWAMMRAEELLLNSVPLVDGSVAHHHSLDLPKDVISSRQVGVS